MRTKIESTSQVKALERILVDLERELVDASDEEILQAARELGLNPEMKGSAAFAGLKYPAKPRLADFLDVSAFEGRRVERNTHERLSGAKQKAAKEFGSDDD